MASSRHWIGWFILAEGLIVLMSFAAMGRRRPGGDRNTVARLLLDDPTPGASFGLYLVLFHAAVAGLLIIAWLSARRKSARSAGSKSRQA